MLSDHSTSTELQGALRCCDCVTRGIITPAHDTG